MVNDNEVQKTIETYEKTADSYFKKHFEIEWIKEYEDYFIANLGGKKILDIGCGPGRDSKYFSEQGLDVTGIDLTSNFVSMASKNAPKAKFVQMDMRKLNFSESSFDGIWVCASLLHIPKKDVKNTLLGFKKVLKSNGLVYLSVKAGKGEKIIEKEEYQGLIKFFAFYSENELEELIKSCGLKVIKITSDEKRNNIWLSIFARKI
jgi:ubiquinone/menaquinone biosynthesis C-methylase UbiE